jgi:branched-chain amino acid transport system permease protein
MVLAFVLLSEFTKAWLLYVGMLFLVMVVYAPGGVASLIMMNLRLATQGCLRKLWVSYLALLATAVVAFCGAAVMVEMVYHLQLNAASGPELVFMTLRLNTQSMTGWFGAGFVLCTGLALFELTRRQFMRDWCEIQEDIKIATQCLEAQ